MIRRHPDVIALFALAIGVLTSQGGAPVRQPTLASTDFKIDRSTCPLPSRIQAVLQKLARVQHRTNIVR